MREKLLFLYYLGTKGVSPNNIFLSGLPNVYAKIYRFCTLKVDAIVALKEPFI